MLFKEIQNLVLSGRLGEAISITDELYPGLLENNMNLLFMLKCRQFIEIINGTDSYTAPLLPSKHRVFNRTLSRGGGSSSISSPCSSPVHKNGCGAENVRSSPSCWSGDRSDRQSPVLKRPHTMSASNGTADVVIAHFAPNSYTSVGCDDMDTSENVVQNDVGVATNGFSVNGNGHILDVGEDADMGNFFLICCCRRLFE